MNYFMHTVRQGFADYWDEHGWIIGVLLGFVSLFIAITAIAFAVVKILQIIGVVR